MFLKIKLISDLVKLQDSVKLKLRFRRHYISYLTQVNPTIHLLRIIAI